MRQAERNAPGSRGASGDGNADVGSGSGGGARCRLRSGLSAGGVKLRRHGFHPYGELLEILQNKKD